MDSWDEIRTAFQVARAGTVSGAAEALGVHHATVIRHIDALEARLGIKLFQRHARGYTPTEAGADLMQVAQATDDQFAQLFGRMRGRGDGLSGDLVITSIANIAALLTPVLTAFQHENPEVRVRYLTGERLFRLEYGEAHVAIRAGTMPEQPDNVVQPFGNQSMSLVAARSYLDRMGTPEGESDFARHRFVGHDQDDGRAPFNRWLLKFVKTEQICFRVTEDTIMKDAVIAGAGIGFVPTAELRDLPHLVEVLPRQPEWTAPLWLVTHVDLHRTAKVQAFLAFLKQEAKSWNC